MPTNIFHITHINNLSSIIKNGCLWSDKQKNVKGLACVSIAHQSLKTRRSIIRVPLSPDGTLDDYVPFFFAPRSPMLYSIHNNNVENYTGGQNPIVYLVSTIDAVIQNGLPFVFYDGHPVMALSQAYNDVIHLNKIDWNVMNSRFWFDSNEDPDRKRRRMAEFLVYDHYPFSLIHEIGVMDATMVMRVTALVNNLQPAPVVSIQNKWYY
jgi:hypothetical protein